MKKIILLIFMLCFAVPFVSACDGLGEKYWEDTANKIEQIVASDNFKQITNFSEISGLSLIPEYGEITSVYVPLFESAVYYTKEKYADLRVSPTAQNLNAFRDQIKNVNNNASAFEAELSIFAQKWHNYKETNIPTLSEASQDNQLDRIMLIKRNFIAVIEKAFNLSESIFDARRVGYYDFANYQDPNLELQNPGVHASLAVHASNLQVCKSTIRVVRAYNASHLAVEYKSYIDASQQFFNQVVKTFNSQKTATLEGLKLWQNTYNMFISDANIFYGFIGALNLKKLKELNYSARAYSEYTNNAQDEIKVTYVLNFYNKVNALKEKTTNAVI